MPRWKWALILGGILSVLFGLPLAVLPGRAFSLIWLVGVCAVALAALLITAFQVRVQDNQGAGRLRRAT